MRGGLCLKAWTKKYQVMSLSTAEKRTVRCSHSRVSRAGQNLWIQKASKSGRFVTKKVGTNLIPADLMTKPLLGRTSEQLMKIMGLRVRGAPSKREGLHVASQVGPKAARGTQPKHRGTEPEHESPMIGDAAAS